MSIERDKTALIRGFKRARQAENARALSLIAPLALFLLIMFVIPIVIILVTAIYSPEMQNVLPSTTKWLKQWKGDRLPNEHGYETLSREIKSAYHNRRLPVVANRLNQEKIGFRNLLMSTGRELASADRVEGGDDAKHKLAEIDNRWKQLEYWRSMKMAAPQFTIHYLLRALDLRRSWEDGIQLASERNRIYITMLGRTLWMSGVVVAICAAIGYPMAYLTANARSSLTRKILLIMILLPFWTSLLVRTAAWVVLLQKEGVINHVLVASGMINEPARLLFTRFSVYVGMSHILLPFMILPIYSVMNRIRGDHMRAASSLGAHPIVAFWTVYLPQTIPGLGAGCLLVFVLSIGFYVTPALLGGADDQMLSYLIAQSTLETANWPLASSLSLVLLVAIAVIYPLFNRYIGIERLRLG